ncbi:MAG: hypothetical protein ABJB74_11880 [Gemmatimonas sp.]
MNATGKQVALIKRTLPSIRLSANEVQSIEARRDDLAKSNNVPASSLNLDIPKIKLPIEWVGFDMDGRLWVSRSVVDGHPHEADIYSPDGKWIAIMQWPATVRLTYLAVKGNSGFGVTYDDDGGVHIVRLTWN